MENNLDNFFKKKLDQREFEMEDAYWAQMEEMIEADEKDNHKGLLWRWLLGTLLLLVVAGGLYWWAAQSAVVVPLNHAHTNTKVETIKSSDDVVKSSNEDNLSSEQVVNTMVKEETIKNTNIGTPTNSNSNKRNFDLEEKQNTENSIRQSSEQVEVMSETDLYNNKNTKLIRENNSNTNSSMPQQIILPAKQQSESVTPSTQFPSLESKEATTKKEKTVKPKLFAQSMTDIPFLDLSSSLLDYQFKKNRKDGLPDLEWQNINRSKKRLSFGITAGIVSFEDNQSNSIQGAELGFTARYQLKDQLAINADLMYFYRGGSYQPIDVTTLPAYSFGRLDYRNELTPENVHYLDLPIYLTYSMNSHVFEAGVSANYLLGVRGATQNILEEGPSQKISDVNWIDKTGFKTIVGNVLLGYRYQINSKLHFGLRATYSLTGYNDLIEDESAISINIDRRMIVQDIRPLHLNFKLTQYF